MNHFRTILMTAALLAVPSIGFAQVSTDAIKDKAVKTVLDNATTDDAMVAGKTMLKGGSKEDAAVAIVKNRVEKKMDAVTGGMSTDDLNKDGLMKAGKDMAAEKMTGKKHDSSTTYSNKSHDSSTTYTDKAAAKAKGMIKTNDAPVIPKSDMMATISTPAAAPVNCPAGTKDAGNGTCMITGDWEP